jgi:hypothetical protein
MNRRQPTIVPRGVYYDDFERRSNMVKVFRLYDSDESAKIDEKEFRKLISDLFVLKGQTCPSDMIDNVVRSIASLIPSVAGCQIDLGEFIEAALARNNSPFNQYSTANIDGGLQDTLLGFFQKKNEALLNQVTS